MKPILIPIAFILVLLTAAHFFMPPEYAWTTNTLSELGAQGLAFGWIMRAGLVGFGLLLAGVLGWQARSQRRLTASNLLVILYGLSILVTGIYSTAPFLSGVEYSARDAGLHSLFASLAGFFLAAGILAAAIANKEDKARIGHLSFLILVAGISALFGMAEGGSLAIGEGSLQRLLWLVGFAWLYWQYGENSRAAEPAEIKPRKSPGRKK